ncbi:hypothetical protein Ari01nite_86520 [Paractinoplanes rishiriensis]|uniref:Uncharacterized protein n=1 Tax=Paractinoplanes rishiriensis TaxID=1050105 RepID=A0A919K9I9_9ACTN|nr:hypothetical protein Ari01nite_86520 [Actinoplanes rishiriensis]
MAAEDPAATAERVAMRRPVDVRQDASVPAPFSSGTLAKGAGAASKAAASAGAGDQGDKFAERPPRAVNMAAS